MKFQKYILFLLPVVRLVDVFYNFFSFHIDSVCCVFLPSDQSKYVEHLFHYIFFWFRLPATNKRDHCHLANTKKARWIPLLSNTMEQQTFFQFMTAMNFSSVFRFLLFTIGNRIYMAQRLVDSRSRNEIAF